MSKHKVPYTWDQIELDIRKVIETTAKALDTYAPMNQPVVKSYLGLNEDDEFDWDDGYATIDISIHRIYDLARRAFNYAYQLDGSDELIPEDIHEVVALLNSGLPECTADGTESPLAKGYDSPIRIMFETFSARHALNLGEFQLSIRDLSLLSGMSEAVVRASLSKEGIKMERGSGGDDSAVSLSSAQALQWLSKRRGFIPNKGDAVVSETKTLLQEGVWDYDIPFEDILALTLRYIGDDIEKTADRVQKSKDWLSSFLNADNVDIDLVALERLANDLKLPPGVFVGRSVTHLITKK